MTTRISKNEYYMRLAETARERGTCSKQQVGACIVQNDAVISLAYNGAPQGIPHCTDDNHLMQHCNLALHAEHNAILNAAKNGQSTLGATLYTTHSPCVECCKILLNAGIIKVYFRAPYKQEEIFFNISSLHFEQL